jgi:hypothetical protein
VSVDAPTAGPRWRRIVRQLLPWLVAAVVLAVLLARYSLADVARELGRPGALLVPPIILATTLLSLCFLASADRVLLAPVLGPQRGWDLARARAGTAMLVGLHHGLSAGGYGLWLVRTGGVAASVGVGAIAYLTATDLGAGLLAALAGSAIGGAAPPGEWGTVVLIAAGALLALVVAAGLLGPRLIGPRWTGALRPAAPWAVVPPRIFLLGLALRLCNVGVWIVGTWAAIVAFGLPLSLGVVAAHLPLVGIVAALPLSVGGFGAAQGAWVLAFAPWTSGESILAFQFVLHWSAAVAFLVRGLPFVKRVVAEIERGRPR